MSMPICSMATTGKLTAHYSYLTKPTSLFSSISLLPPPRSNCTNIPTRNDGRRSSHIARARKGLSSRTRRLEKKKEEEEAKAAEEEAEAEFERSIEFESSMVYSTEPMPNLEGLEPDFWEGSKWDAFGFFVRYMWAFGVLFGLVACGVAVATYNEGATDFKKTTVYKESVQSRELLEEPEASNSDVFEANPTEDAPSLE